MRKTARTVARPAPAAAAPDNRQHVVTAGALVLVLLLGVVRISGVLGGPSSGDDQVAEAEAEAADAALAQERRQAQSEQRRTGMVLSVPKIGLEAPVVELGKGDGGELDAPRRFENVGWWSDGVVPGEAGPAVIAGHVDSVEGPAVFHRLHELLPGDEVLVRHEDDTVARFVVTHSAQVEKDSFPTSEVYGKVSDPELRLITCSGTFDRAARHYTGNLIVFAALHP